MGQGFDQWAGIYDPMMRFVFGKAIQECQLIFLEHISPNAQVLIVGGGTGWILPKLWQTRPGLDITYLELSSRMMRKARTYAAPYPNKSIQFILGDPSKIPTRAQYEVIFTHFFLDLFEPPKAQKIAWKLYEHLKPGGQWHYADFHASPNSLDWRRIFIRAMYLIARWGSTLEAQDYWDYVQTLHTMPLQMEHEHFFYGQMIQSLFFTKPLLSRADPAVSPHTKAPRQ